MKIRLYYSPAQTHASTPFHPSNLPHRNQSSLSTKPSSKTWTIQVHPRPIPIRNNHLSQTIQLPQEEEEEKKELSKDTDTCCYVPYDAEPEADADGRTSSGRSTVDTASVG